MGSTLNRFVGTSDNIKIKFAWAIPIPDKKMETVASMLYNSDQGKEFVNQVIQGMCDLMGITKTQTSAYSPQGNAYAERIHRFFRNAISGMMIAYNSAYHSAIKTTPATAFFGENINAPC